MTVKGGTSQACAACKFQRRKCSSECPLAPYFPASKPKMFQNAHKLFGVSNIMKILKQLDTKEQKDEAMKSVIYESEARERFPVHGCCEIISHLRYQWAQACEELQYVRARLSMLSDDCHNNMIVDHQIYPSSELQLGMNSPGNALMMMQHQTTTIPFESNPFVVNGGGANNGVYVDSNDDIAKQLWVHQHPNYNNGNDAIDIQSQLMASQAFPLHQETEVDYDDIQFDTIADDRQSYVESKEVCESSCQSAWKDTTTQSIEHVSQNDLKSAAACFSLTSVN